MQKIFSLRTVKSGALDALLVVLSLYIAFALRFNFAIPRLYFNQFLVIAPLVVALRCGLLAVFDVYRLIPRYASTTDFMAIFKATTLGTLLIALINGIVVPFLPAVNWLYAHEGHIQRISWPIIIMEWAFTLILVGGSRFIQRTWHVRFLERKPAEDVRRVLILGAGDVGETMARQMRNSALYQAVGFLDDDPEKIGRLIHGLPVIGPIADVGKVVRSYNVDEVLIAIPGIEPVRLQDIMRLCEHAAVSFKILPTVHDILEGKVSLRRIRPVEIEDLLGREEINLQLPPEKNYVRDEIVLVTGAGGSIGSELCRQVLELKPQRLILLGHGENSLYEISNELRRRFHSANITSVVADIRDMHKMERVFQEFRPTVIFHAAAHKHVPLMEYDADEAVKNNVVGTFNVAFLADRYGAKRFILISSDKAVRPTNVMGATKRVAEMVVFCIARRSKTLFAAVRFGNVLGSRGSVIPLFKRQIAEGGPITLTHPEVTRYFMTIPEAVSLVIKAGSMDEQAKLYVLDMGKPVKIADLARRLIQLSGFDPDKGEIKIVYTGLRPGEKLTEELLTATENVRRTEIGKVFVAEPENVDCELLWRKMEELEERAAASDGEGIRRVLKELVPDYQPASPPPR
ncbi:MAG: polysaccharide biosynthesis protein [Candidatus Sumerlaeaceae bacterium]